jgi:hypothetical protein
LLRNVTTKSRIVTSLFRNVIYTEWSATNFKLISQDKASDCCGFRSIPRKGKNGQSISKKVVHLQRGVKKK